MMAPSLSVAFEKPRIYHFRAPIGGTVPRTPGAKNRTPREIEKDAKHQAKEAKLKRRLEQKNAVILQLKAQKRAPRGAK